jgi:hypothetical protein
MSTLNSLSSSNSALVVTNGHSPVKFRHRTRKKPSTVEKAFFRIFTKQCKNLRDNYDKKFDIHVSGHIREVIAGKIWVVYIFFEGDDPTLIEDSLSSFQSIAWRQLDLSVGPPGIKINGRRTRVYCPPASFGNMTLCVNKQYPGNHRCTLWVDVTPAGNLDLKQAFLKTRAIN